MRPQRQTWRNHCTLEGLASSLHRTNLWGTSTLCRLAHLQISRLGAPDLTKCPGALSHKFASRVLLPFSYVIIIIHLRLYTSICFCLFISPPPSPQNWWATFQPATIRCHWELQNETYFCCCNRCYAFLRYMNLLSSNYMLSLEKKFCVENMWVLCLEWVSWPVLCLQSPFPRDLLQECVSALSWVSAAAKKCLRKEQSPQRWRRWKRRKPKTIFIWLEVTPRCEANQ